MFRLAFIGWVLSTHSVPCCVLEAPNGYALVLDDVRQSRQILRTSFNTVEVRQIGILYTSDYLAVADAASRGGESVAENSDGVKCGFVAINSYGRVYNPLPGLMECDHRSGCGRIQLCRLASIRRDRNLSADATIEEGDELGWPGQDGWPKLRPTRYAYSVSDSSEELFTRSCTLKEHIAILYHASW